MTLDDFKLGHAGTVAPLVVKDKVIVGNSGGDLPTRGFIDAYDAADRQARVALLHDSRGGRARQRNVVVRRVLPRGGGAAWTTGSFDPDLNLIYWGTGNPNPDYYGGDRLGDNLYTASIVAARRGYGKAAMALPVHAARHARLGRATRFRCSPTSRFAGSAAGSRWSPAATGFSTCSIAHRRASPRQAVHRRRSGRARSARTANRSS